MTIRWEKHSDDTFFAYHGNLYIGMVGKIISTPERYVWSLTAVSRITGMLATRGEVSSMKQAKVSLSRAWKKWLTVAGLKEA